MKSCPKLAFFLRSALSAAVVIACSGFAVTQTIDAIGGRAASVSNDIRYSEWQLKNLKTVVKTVEPRKRDWTTARTDFLRIQTASGEMLAHAQSANIETESLALLVGEINKCARRLKQQLPLPEFASPASPPAAAAKSPFQGAFAELDELIVRFAFNPAFKSEFVVDAENSRRAAQDLAQIIFKSRILKKRLKKPESF